MPGAGEVLKSLSGVFPERGERLWALGSAVRVGGGQYPVLTQLCAESAAVLDLPEVPDLFVMRSAEAQAMAIGIDQPFVLLTTGIVEALDTEALRFVIGHELGHVLSGHAVFRTLLLRLLDMQVTWSWVPAGAVGVRAVIAALLEWFRKAELTADRAGLLCSQDPAAALRAHVYMAGGTTMGQIDLTAFSTRPRNTCIPTTSVTACTSCAASSGPRIRWRSFERRSSNDGRLRRSTARSSPAPIRAARTTSPTAICSTTSSTRPSRTSTLRPTPPTR